MKIFAFVNQKGGVGKTTSAVNLATAVAAVGKRVLLVDLDSQGNASTAFGISPDKRKNNIYDVFSGESSLADVIKKSNIPNLDIIVASIDLSAVDVELANTEGKELILEQAFIDLRKNLDKDYDFVIIDCPPSLGLLTVNALVVANYTIIPMQCEFYSLEGVSYLMNTIEIIKANLNPELQIGGVLLTMYDRRNKLTRDVEDDVREHMGDMVFDTIIPRNVKLSEAPSHGLPGILYDHNAIGSKAYMLLAREFLKKFS